MKNMGSFFKITVALYALLAGCAAGASEGSGSYPSGIQMEIAGGFGSAAIQNPDNTTANYSILGLEAHGHIPIIGGDVADRFALDLTGGVKYLDLKNTAEIGAQREYANMIGPGAGVHMRVFKFVAGAEYNLMFARHYAVGPVSRELQYSAPMLNYYGGIVIPLQHLAVSVLYSASQMTIPKDRSGLSQNSAYTDQVYWVNFTYSTGASFGNFMKFLF